MTVRVPAAATAALADVAAMANSPNSTEYDRDAAAADGAAARSCASIRCGAAADNAVARKIAKNRGGVVWDNSSGRLHEPGSRS